MIIVFVLATVAIVAVIAVMVNQNKEDPPQIGNFGAKEGDKNAPIMIYQYHGSSNTVRCRVCDVENPVSADCCMVCGESLS